MNKRMMLALVPLLPLLGGCSDYAGSYYYTPRPGMAELRSATTQPATVAAGLAVISGVRKADADLGIPDSVEVRFRLDNNGPQEIVFDPATLELSGGSLTRFEAALVRPREAVTLPPQQSAAFIAWFPFPGGRPHDKTDLSSLQLRWLVQVGGQAVRQDILFQRVYPVQVDYYDPYWDYPYWGYPRRGFYGGYHGFYTGPQLYHPGYRYYRR
jgi:hypothetical protein